MAGSDQVINNTEQWLNRTAAAAYALSQHYSGEMEGYAKAHAPWTDRTGHARQGLFGSVHVEGPMIKTRISHSMAYGPYLELAMHGAYSILKPTVTRMAPDYYRDLQRLVR